MSSKGDIYCQCYKNAKNTHVRCGNKAKPNSIFCGIHQRCGDKKHLWRQSSVGLDVPERHSKKSDFPIRARPSQSVSSVKSRLTSPPPAASVSGTLVTSEESAGLFANVDQYVTQAMCEDFIKDGDLRSLYRFSRVNKQIHQFCQPVLKKVRYFWPVHAWTKPLGWWSFMHRMRPQPMIR